MSMTTSNRQKPSEPDGDVPVDDGYGYDDPTEDPTDVEASNCRPVVPYANIVSAANPSAPAPPPIRLQPFGAAANNAPATRTTNTNRGFWGLGNNRNTSSQRTQARPKSVGGGNNINVQVNLPETTNSATGEALPPWHQCVLCFHAAWTALMSVRHHIKCCKRCKNCCSLSKWWQRITALIGFITIVTTFWGIYGGLFSSLSVPDFGGSSSDSSSDSGSSSTTASNRDYTDVTNAPYYDKTTAATNPPINANVVGAYATKSDDEIQAIVSYINSQTLTNATLRYVPYTDESTRISYDELALQWTVEYLPYYATTTALEKFYLVQCYALYTLFARQYQSNNNVKWYDHTNWLTAPENECNWYGIACTSIDLGGTLGEAYVVTSIDLSANNLSMDLSPDVGLLVHVEYFDVSDNPLLTGPIPQSIANWDKVQSFDVSGTDLTGSTPALV